MKILDIKAMNGPNYWSVNRHHLIVMLLDLQAMEERPSNTVPGFRARLEQLMPSLYSHRCSEGHEGGFFERVEMGTWMGHIIEHIALEMQTLAGMEVGFGRTRSAPKKGQYYVVFSYYEEKAGIYAAKASVGLVEALIRGEDYDLNHDIQTLREIRENDRLGPSTGSLVDEARRRKIPWIRLNKRSLVQLGYGKNQQRVQATVASTTSNIAVEIACNKEETKNLLEAAEVPVPKGVIIRSEEELEWAIRKVGFPMVTKPLNGNHGRGATTDLQTLEEVRQGFQEAQKHSHSVIVEKFITGLDHRVLVINYKFVAAAVRTPAAVTGNGTSTIQELIDEVNKDPRRGFGHEKVLTEIKVDRATNTVLEGKGLTLESVLPEGEELWLKPTANLSTGGTATDVTDHVHPDNIILCERIARIIGLDICGIDIMTDTLETPLRQGNGAVLEVNAAPGFRMHLDPTEGLPRNVAGPVIDMLFPPGTSARIPIIAVAGTNGKTTTTRLTAHIMRQTGKTVGYTTTDGVYIGNEMMVKGDCTGPKSAEFVLKDPTVEIAVLESARGGILRAGLGYHNCDIAIVTNVAPDHLGLGGIDTLTKLARVKAVVPNTVFSNGHAILNADDDLVYAMRNELDCHIVLFSTDPESPRIKRHTAKGRLAGVYENGYITILKDNWKIRVERAANIPITFNGAAMFNIYNTLGAVLAAYVSQVPLDTIRGGLQTFVPSAAQTPGRMNMFHFRDFTVMLDYAHNTHGMKAIGGFLQHVPATQKIGIIAGVGDRRDEDTIDLGEESAKTFDEIIIRQDKNTRGRPAEEIVELLKTGIAKVKPNMPVKVILKESDAIDYALQNAKVGSFITVISDVIPDALEQVKAYKEREGTAF
ncbi:MAG: cyanophycin synthetase [Sphingobacteriales bacterium]|nr:MAG: cyanophycin synthetase [Sphingobacteriales bacterium]